MIRRLLLGTSLLAALASPALADFTFTLGVGATAFSFTAATGGTALCAAASTHCFASVPVNTAGAQLFTSGNPGLVTLTGTNTIVGTGTFGVQATLAAETTKVIGTVNQGTSPWLGVVRDAAGNARGANVNAANQLSVSCDNGCTASTSITGWAGSTLGAITTYGSTPGAVLVPSVNAFITNVNANGQATPANSSPVVQAGLQYETVAATVTAQVLGGAGATGDYLSHCTVFPTSVSPGVVTVFDNTSTAATNVIAFPGGTTSLSNLAPISFPVGAFSTAGPWKATTGANLVLTCYGKFT